MRLAQPPGARHRHRSDPDGHHVFRDYFRMRVSGSTRSSRCICATSCAPTTSTTSLSKGPRSFDDVRHKFHGIISRFAGFQAHWLNVHTDFPLLQKSPSDHGRRGALPVSNPRHTMVRLLEVLLHAAPKSAAGPPATSTRPAHHLRSLRPMPTASTDSRYDLRKLEGHALLERDGGRYAYHLTPKGVHVALSSCSSTSACADRSANTQFHHRPDPQHRPNSPLERAYHRADTAMQNVVGSPRCTLTLDPPLSTKHPALSALPDAFAAPRHPCHLCRKIATPGRYQITGGLNLDILPGDFVGLSCSTI